MSRTFNTRPHYVIAAQFEAVGRATPKHHYTCVEFDYDAATYWQRRMFHHYESRGELHTGPCTLGKQNSNCGWDIPNPRDHETVYKYRGCGCCRPENYPESRIRRVARESLNDMRREYNHHGDCNDDWTYKSMPRRKVWV